MERSGLFISYSKSDKEWLDAINVHLKVLEREHRFTIWEDSKIQPGSNWRAEISKATKSCKVALLLISGNFLSSDFIIEEELPSLLAAAKNEGALIFPLILNHCMFSDFPSLSRFQALNVPSKPVIELTEGERNKLFVDVTKKIKEALTSPVKGPGRQTGSANSIVEQAEYKYRMSLARVCILAVLWNERSDTGGLMLGDIHQQSKVKNRKYIAIALREMLDAGLVSQFKQNGNTYWRLTEQGLKLAKEVESSVLYS